MGTFRIGAQFYVVETTWFSPVASLARPLHTLYTPFIRREGGPSILSAKVVVDEALFEKEERDLFIARFRFCAYYLGVPLILLFTLVDSHFPRDLFLTILKARLLSIPFCILCTSLYRYRVFREKYYVVPAYLFACYLGGYLAYLVSFTGYDVSPYYAGLNLVGIAAFSFLPWNGPHMFIAGAVLYAPYLAVLGSLGGGIVGHLGPHLAFCLSTIGIGVITNFSTRRLRRREVTSRVRLITEIANKNKVIEQKTKEGIYLERLASQFSPQVIDAVKSGRVKIEGLIRREVTCLFIDVESSTSRSIRLDQDDYTRVLSDFFSLAVEILLRHNVTVGTYLGDGLLGFTNAPEEQAHHRMSALRACLDILRMHEKRRRHYVEKWRTDFNIRIGINAGQAFVGFFPSFKLGTYTAIGATVNLASRLCSQAAPNTVLVTKAFLREIGEGVKDVTVRHVKTVDSIKGFEGETFELCSVEPLALAPRDQTSCPQCAGTVVEKNDLGDYLLVKCVACGHSDLIGRHDLVRYGT